MNIGPVELLILTFPGNRASCAATQGLAEVVSRGYVTVLDLVFITRTGYGLVQITDADEDLDAVGLGSLQTSGQVLISEDDLDVVQGALKPGTSAAVIAYEHSWTRRLAAAVEDADGEVALHVQVPHDAVQAALAAAAS